MQQQPIKKNHRAAIAWCGVGIALAALLGVAASRWRGGSSGERAALSAGTQSVSDGAREYELTVPRAWYVEKNMSRDVAVYSSTTRAGCKVELERSSTTANVDRAAWIAARLGGDPTVAIAERSSDAIMIDGTREAVRWQGTMDGVTTTIVFAFTDGSAYEIVPSSLSGSYDAACDAMLEAVIHNLKF